MSRGGRFGKYGELKRKGRLRHSRLAKSSHTRAKPKRTESNPVGKPAWRRRKHPEPTCESPEEQPSE